ncbi:hypothetical protein CIRG_09817 [Coccidioides immitis RMSCC 2394]|uniref:Uncharacterized protein n=1 Tax=Coccidioides immitis RMSCC 2394 TaxID=404692 RepID=A0A0J7BH77_COCIT|nr:hypothetical protein CIRG_09817 [Coccidioides immitis RMSCC 2394]
MTAKSRPEEGRTASSRPGTSPLPTEGRRRKVQGSARESWRLDQGIIPLSNWSIVAGE